MNTLTITFTAVLAAANATNAQNLLDFEKKAGNGTAKGTVSFVANINQNEMPGYSNYYYSRTQIEATAKVFGKRFSVIDLGARAYTHDGGSHHGRSIAAARVARAWLEVGGVEVQAESSSTSAMVSYRRYIPIAGPNKKFGVGPFSVKVRAGLGAYVEPQMEANVNRATKLAETSVGGEVGVLVGASGSLNAGVGSVKVTSDLELAGVGLDLNAMAKPGQKGLFMKLSGHALRLLIKLKCTTRVGINYTKTLIDRKLARWNKRWDI